MLKSLNKIIKSSAGTGFSLFLHACELSAVTKK
jgi:hypothetical protein